MTDNTIQEFTNIWDALEDDPAIAANLRARSTLMDSIITRFEDIGWSQSVAAANLGVSQPRISDLCNGKIDKFSLDMLVNIAAQVGLYVDLQITQSSSSEDTARHYETNGHQQLV